MSPPSRRISDIALDALDGVNRIVNPILPRRPRRPGRDPETTDADAEDAATHQLLAVTPEEDETRMIESKGATD